MGAGLGAKCSTYCTGNFADGEDEGMGLVGLESLSVLDWGHGLSGGEPVGRIFEDNLGVMSVLDRDLLRFSGTSAMSAVSWLLHMGASEDTVDANGTSCLHAACRSGSLSVVRKLLRKAKTSLVNLQDVAGWTPLHIASHMGRRTVVTRLLEAKANAVIKNCRGLTPWELCKDQGTLQALSSSSTAGDGRQVSKSKSQSDDVDERGRGELMMDMMPRFSSRGSQATPEDIVGLPLECEPELFFVNPKPVFQHTTIHKKSLLALAAAIFDMQPSHGLAVAVLAGLEESYTAAMKLLLKHGGVNKEVAGDFLGQSLSVCPLIRFNFFDSLLLLNTGVVSSLKTAFSALGCPTDLRKLDRLLWAMANVWWKKHKSLSISRANTGSTVPLKKPPLAAFGKELVGLELCQYLSGPEVLYHLLFSTVMLHWHIWGGSEIVSKKEPMSEQTWVALNTGMECHGEADVPRHVQSKIFADMLHCSIPELCGDSFGGCLNPHLPADSLDIGNSVPMEALPGTISMSIPRSGKVDFASKLGPRATAEGWISVLHDVLMPGYVGTAECSHMAREREASSHNPSRMWASLCSICLVLSASQPGPGSVPHAIIDCRSLHIVQLDMKARVLKLIGSAQGSAEEAEEPPVKCAKLLLDGRWEEFRLRQLVLRFEQPKMIEIWVKLLMQKPFDATLSPNIAAIIKPEPPTHNGALGAAAATFKHVTDDSNKVFLGFL